MKTTAPERNPWVMALRSTLAVTITIGVALCSSSFLICLAVS